MCCVVVVPSLSCGRPPCVLPLLTPIIARLDYLGNFFIEGEANIGGVASDGSGKVVCIKSDGTLGTCTDTPDGGGTCTCN